VGEYPARETVQVAALPKGAKVEISVIAYKPKNKLHKRK
jgi:enamine deaminase RidA (YjgF/YER057c/UK114 family)